MNLLNYQNRFRTLPGTPQNVDKLSGYTYALSDLLKYMEEITLFDPSRRFVDSVDIINTISETNAELTKYANEFKRLDLNSDKVKTFLNDQI